ncbi:unnamed protein product [Miscanthus lutarioriparius]|uniref:DUF659 domain-containing protein n=1 Tax=Miscanthus lutarioriparius TaxID=422564 RepID=A0A811P7K2_9POAL|nr:unnamed protein product [Miscanthus lutarioriparius]
MASLVPSSAQPSGQPSTGPAGTMSSPPSIVSGYDPKNDLARKPQRSKDPAWSSVRGGIKRLKQHLAGGYGDAKLCSGVSTEVRREMAAYLDANKWKRPLVLDDEVVEVAANEAPANEAAAAPTIVSSTKTKEEKHYVDTQWALFFYECGIPFNAAVARQFQIAVEATAQYGSGYKPPTPYQLGDPLLQEAVKSTSTMREEHERAWKHYGCTLMSDGWSDRRGRHLINFLVNSPEGTYFLESIDASSEVHDAYMLAGLLEKKVEEIGKDKVVQVVTDNGANFKAAGKILMDRIPTIFWSPCAAHCLDLMLEDIGNLSEFKKPITRARRVTTFIYRHGRILSAMREKTGGADLVRPAATRFAMAFLTLKSLYKHKDALKSLMVSEAWTGNKLAKTKAGLDVHDIVLSTQFWNSVEDCLRASAPLLIVFRVVDGDEKPAMPEVQALMNLAKERINQSFAIQSKKSLLKKIMGIIERHWEKQMDHPLMVEDGETRSKINAQAMDYEYLRGDAFSNKMAIQNLESMSPLDWWRSYGGRAIELQRFARRVVSLCASSSGCERNWSKFESIHTKKRNRLLHKRLNSIVFVSYNRKMKSRFQKLCQNQGKNFDPLVIEDFDWNNEWADSLHVPPQGTRGCDCDLTWNLVDEAVGASQSLQGWNFPRVAHRRARNSAPMVDEAELGSDNEENPDPFDDADVTDCEDDPNDANEIGEDNEAANVAGEFDDGY